MSPRYRDASATVEERVADLLSRMTEEEKTAQLCSTDLALPPRANPKVLSPVRILGMARVDIDSINSIADRQYLADTIKHLQNATINGTRFGIPVLFHATPSGRTPHAQDGPAPLAVAASWQPALAQKLAAVKAMQLRRMGVQLLSGTSLEISDDPRRFGLESTFGEDPHLVSEMGLAVISGLQATSGKNSVLPDDKVWAAITHFVGRSLPDSNFPSPLPLGNRELHERFLPPFAAAIAGDVSAVVAARTDFDATPVHGNKRLLENVLRAELGFKGLSLAAPSGIADLHTIYRVSPNLADATRLAFSAGIDAGFHGDAACEALTQSVRDGGIAQSRLDTAVGRVLDLKFRAGLFETPFALLSTQKSMPDHQDVFLNAARHSIVLLKNDGALPLVSQASQGKEHITIVSTNLQATDAGKVAHNVAERLRETLLATVEVVRYAEHAQLGRVSANSGTIVLLCDGEKEQIDPCLIPQIARDSSRRVLVVLANPRTRILPSLVDGSNAVLAAWNLGKHAAEAIADVLVGKVNPGGKLPISIPRSAGQLPVHYNAKPSARRGYLFDSAEPLFAFGWGLSYAAIEVGAPRIAHLSVSETDNIQVFVDVRNSSDFAAAETVQLYVRSKANSVTRPVKELRAFQHVHLSAREHKTVSLTFPTRSLAQWDERMQHVVIPGDYELMVGPNSQHLKSVQVTVKGNGDK